MFVLLLCQSKERRKRNLGCLPEHLQLEDEGIIFQATHLTTLFPELVFCLVPHIPSVFNLFDQFVLLDLFGHVWF